MNNEEKLREILKTIDALKGEVESLLPKPRPVVKPIVKPAVMPVVKLVDNGIEASPLSSSKKSSPYEPDLFDKVGDWFCVRGAFAPKGVTREFAVATRWLLRVGSLLLVGAMAYFVTLAINRGWIGPTQRVCGMLFWGAVGLAGGIWLKLKSERYSILGEVFAALGLVGLYFGFGLGHRYFDPPVIASTLLAFAGLVLTTLAAGTLAVRLKSIGIAALGLLGGFLVPMICRFDGDYISLAIYLFLLSLGGVTVAWLRRWTLFGYAACGTAFLMLVGRAPVGHLAEVVGYVHQLLQYMFILALTVHNSRERHPIVNAYFWVIVSLMAIGWLISSSYIISAVGRCCNFVTWNFVFAAVLHTTLAIVWRKLNWFGEPVLIVFAVVSSALAILNLCMDSHLWLEYALFIYIVFGAILGELAVRVKSRTLSVLANIVVICSTLGWIFAVIECYSHIVDYSKDFIFRLLNFWVLPALPFFLASRLGGCMKKVYVILGCLETFVIVTSESHCFGHLVVPTIGGGMTTLVWAVIASALLVTGIAARRKVLRFGGLGLLGLAILKILVLDTAALGTPSRVTVFAAVGVLLLVGAFLYLKFRNLFETEKGGK